MAGKARELKTRIRLDGEAEYKKQLGDISSRMRTLNSDLDVCATRMKTQGESADDLRAQQSALCEQYVLQQDRLKILTEMLEKSNARYGESSRESQKLKTQINQTTVTMLKLENSLDECDAALKSHAGSVEKTTSGHDRLKGAVKSAAGVMGGALVAGAKAAAAALAAVGAATAAAATHMWELSGEGEAGMAQLSAQTGLTGAELEALGGIARQVYRDNFGGSLDEVNADLATVRQNTGLMGDALKDAVEAGYMLNDTFGMDQVESSRAAAAMMEKFGISAEEAYNLIAVGAQKGANQNGDLLDVLSEYAPHYAAMGLSAEQMMQTLINGAEGGVFQIDKVGDAMKEFSIRAIDGSEGTKDAFKMLGLNAKATSSAIAQGGPAAEAAFQQVVAALMSVEDPLKRNQAAVALFGTQYEDLGAAALPILSGITNTSATAVDALGQINNVRYNTFEDAVSGVGRQIEGEFLPLMNTVRQSATNALTEISQTLSDGFQPEDVQAIGQTISTHLFEGIQGLSGLLNENMEFVSDAMGLIVDAAATALPPLLDSLLPAAMELLQSVLDSLIENVEPISKLAGDLVTNIADFLITNAPGLVDAAGELLVGLVDGLLSEDGLTKLTSAAMEMIGSLGGSLVENAITLIAKAPEIIAQLVKGLLATDWIKVGTDIWNGLINGLTSAGESLKEAFAAPFTKILDKIKELFGIHSPSTVMAEIGDFLLQGLGGGLSAGVQAVLDVVGDVFGRIWKAIKNVFGFGDSSEESKEAKQAGKDIMTGMQEGIAGDEEKLKEKIRSVATNALATFRSEFGIDEGASTSTKLKAYGQAIVQGILDGIEEKATSGFQGKAYNAAHFCAEAFNREMGIEGYGFSASGDASKFKYIGTSICDGIASGIENGSSRVSAAARTMAQAAYNAAKSTLGIHSPSTKFAYLADMSMEGYTGRLSARMGDVRRGVQAMNSALQDSMPRAQLAGGAGIDYAALARAMKAEGLGTVILQVDGRELGRSVEAGVSVAQYRKSANTIVGRSSRLVLA